MDFRRHFLPLLLVAAALGLGPGLAAADIGPDLELDRELRSGADRSCREDVAPPMPRSRPAPTAAAVLPPAQGPYIGSYQIPASPEEIGAFAESTGGFPPIVFTFHDWYDYASSREEPAQPFNAPLEGDGNLRPLQLAEHLRQRGSVLALAWSIYCCDIDSFRFWTRLKRPYGHFQRILDGADDEFIRTTARQIRDWGHPIMLTIVAEFNWQGQFAFGADGRRWMDSVDDICGQYGDPAWPDGPERIRDLFIHVIDLFREEGAHNVTWFMYSGNQYMAQNVEGQSKWLHPRFYYPGDDYIDWVGQSVYFIDPAWPVDFKDTGSFEAVFRPGYEAWRTVTDRPMFLPEFGILAEPERDRTDLWRRVFQEYLPGMPAVQAVTVADSLLFELYFNLPRISTRPADSALLRQLIDDGNYSRTLRTGPRQ